MFEPHCHSYVSDGVSSPENIVRRAKLRGVHALAVTDHDTFRGSILAYKVSRLFNVLVVFGAEVLTSWGDILVLCPEPMEEPLPSDPFVLRDEASKYNCALIAPHPFHPPPLPSVGFNVLRHSSVFDAVEIWNAKGLPIFNIPAIIVARRVGKPRVSGSDCHIPSALGVAPTLVDSDGASVEGVVEAILKGRVIPTIGVMGLRAVLDDVAWSLFKSV